MYVHDEQRAKYIHGNTQNNSNSRNGKCSLRWRECVYFNLPVTWNTHSITLNGFYFEPKPAAECCKRALRGGLEEKWALNKIQAVECRTKWFEWPRNQIEVASLLKRKCYVKHHHFVLTVLNGIVDIDVVVVVVVCRTHGCKIENRIHTPSRIRAFP